MADDSALMLASMFSPEDTTPCGKITAELNEDILIEVGNRRKKTFRPRSGRK
jgi:hypothetical protein